MEKEVISASVYNAPEDGETIEFYTKLVEENPKALIHVPVQFKTYDICLMAVIKSSYMIKYVPARIITQEFVDELLMYGVSIPDIYQGYVKLCVEANANNFSLGNKTPVETKTESLIPEEVKNIELKDLSNLFSLHTINIIEQHGIFTLGDLIHVVDTPILCVECFGTSSYYDEIVNTVRLLKCKYLDEDPIINIFDNQECSEEFFNLLGVRIVSNRLLDFWKDKSIKDFFDLIKQSSTEKELMKIRNFGKNQVISLIERATIVLDYYAKHSENWLNIKIINEQLNAAKKEFEKLKDDRQRLDEQIELALKKIQELTIKQLQVSEKLEKKQRLG